MVFFPKNAKFPKTAEVAQSLGLSKAFVSKVIHGKATSNRVAQHIFAQYQIRLRGYNYED